MKDSIIYPKVKAYTDELNLHPSLTEDLVLLFTVWYYRITRVTCFNCDQPVPRLSSISKDGSRVFNETCSKACRKELRIKRNLTDFLDRAPKIHNGKYSYRLIEFSDFFINYKQRNTKVPIICPTCGVFYQSFKKHLEGAGCYYCKAVEARKRNRSTFIKEATRKHKHKYSYCNITPEWWKKNYKNSKTKLPLVCPTHGLFYQNAFDHLQNNGCNLCGIAATAEQVRLQPDEILEKLNKLEPGLGVQLNYDLNYIIENFKKFRPEFFKIRLVCDKHGNQISSGINLNKDMIVGCPKCKRSKGEQKITKFLTQKGILFLTEFKPSFETFRFDFFLPGFNLAIEFDGIQHQQPVKFFGGLAAYLKTRKRDLIKNQFCRRNGIRLLRIPWTEYDIINKTLKYKLEALCL